MTREDIIQYCLSLGEDVVLRYPYGPQPLVLSVAPKQSFCNFYEYGEPLHLVLKCDPVEAELLRTAFPCVQPGYHCNKTHWNSVYLDGTLPDEQIQAMLEKAYRLVKKKKKRAQKTR